jgi:hypothetical protein
MAVIAKQQVATEIPLAITPELYRSYPKLYRNAVDLLVREGMVKIIEGGEP